MIKQIQPCIGDIWDYHEGGRYIVVDFVRHFETEEVFVVCESFGEKRIWPKDAWFHLVPYRGADAPAGAMVRPFTLVQIGLKPRSEAGFDQLSFDRI